MSDIESNVWDIHDAAVIAHNRIAEQNGDAPGNNPDANQPRHVTDAVDPEVEARKMLAIIGVEGVAMIGSVVMASLEFGPAGGLVAVVGGGTLMVATGLRFSKINNQNLAPKHN